MNRVSLVLTVIAEDRPGVIEAVAEAVATHGGNWEESRMARLGGRFAGILLVAVDGARAAELKKALRGLETRGIRTLVEHSDDAAGASRRRVRLELLGQDRTGIIREISHALAGRGVNVEELETACEEAPMAGGELFRMSALLSCPPDLSADELRGVLEALAHDLMVDVALRDE